VPSATDPQHSESQLGLLDDAAGGGFLCASVILSISSRLDAELCDGGDDQVLSRNRSAWRASRVEAHAARLLCAAELARQAARLGEVAATSGSSAR